MFCWRSKKNTSKLESPPDRLVHLDINLLPIRFRASEEREQTERDLFSVRAGREKRDHPLW
jgi:hypothetical protein